MRMEASRHVEQIDGLRAVAVLAVVCYHALLDAWAPGKAPMWVGCGARGVDLFFAISGFCLAYPILRAFRADGSTTVDYSRFFARRISRIAPTYWVALTVFGLLGLTSFGFPTARGVPISIGTLGEFFADALFQTTASPTFNASFWTLGVEMRWYLLFPILIAIYMRSRVAFGAIAIGCSLVYHFVPFSDSISDEGTLPGFLVGIVAADLSIVRSWLRRYADVAAVVAIALAVALQATTPRIDHGSPAWQVAAFCLVFAATGNGLGRLFRWKPLRFIGMASYAIYLIHEPILQKLDALGVSPWLSSIVAVAAGSAFYRLVERRLSDVHVRGPIEDAICRSVAHLKIFRRRLPLPIPPGSGIR